MGDLGQHTYIFKGFPIYTPQTRVFQQVGCGKLSRRFIVRLIEEQILYAVLITTVLTFGFTKLTVLLFYKRYEAFIISRIWNSNVAPESFKGQFSKLLAGS